MWGLVTWTLMHIFGIQMRHTSTQVLLCASFSSVFHGTFVVFYFHFINHIPFLLIVIAYIFWVLYLRAYSIQGVLNVCNFYTSVILRSLGTLFRHLVASVLIFQLTYWRHREKTVNSQLTLIKEGNRDTGNAFMFFFGMSFVFLLDMGAIVLKNQELSRGNKIWRNSIMIS